MFNHSTIINQRTMATEVQSQDLPTDPISHLLLTIEGYNATDEVTVAEILTFINRLQVLDDGRNVINLDGEHLAALNLYLFGSAGHNQHPIATDNFHVGYTLIIPFGRKLYTPEECYPGRPLGKVQLVWDTTVPATSFDSAVMTVEAVQLPGASPRRWLKSTQKTLTAPGATGEFDHSLNTGNSLVALLIEHTAVPGASEFLHTVNAFEILKDNVQTHYTSTRTAAQMGNRMLRVPSTIRMIAAQDDLAPPAFNWLDFDPNRDDAHLLDARGTSDLKIRCNYAENAALEISQIDLVTV